MEAVLCYQQLKQDGITMETDKIYRKQRSIQTDSCLYGVQCTTKVTFQFHRKHELVSSWTSGSPFIKKKCSSFGRQSPKMISHDPYFLILHSCIIPFSSVSWPSDLVLTNRNVARDSVTSMSMLEKTDFYLTSRL